MAAGWARCAATHPPLQERVVEGRLSGEPGETGARTIRAGMGGACRVGNAMLRYRPTI